MTVDVQTSQPVEQTLFVRKASGLVKGWSSSDGYRYAFFSTNVFFGMTSLSYCVFIPGGSMFWSLIITAALVVLGVIVYAAMISAMPRAGGDYVWQTRIFNSPIGFILAATGWWFILWQWVPIYSNITVIYFLNPILRIIGWDSAAAWLGTSNGVFVAALAVIAIASYLCAIGMRGYARVQRVVWIVGLAGLAVLGLALLFSSKADFVNAYNREALQLYGVKDAYAATLAAGGSGLPTSAFGGSAWETIRLIPFMCFWLLWPVWGATLYGEVRGAKEFRKNAYAMGAALFSVAAIGIAFILLATKTMGFSFFSATNGAYWAGTSPLNGEFISPVAMASWLIDSAPIQVVLILAASGLVVGMWGTVFLSSTRVVFASAFDRVLPERAAMVTPSGVPIVALLLMAIPSIVVSAFYAYTSWYATLTLDAAVVIAVTFLGTGLACMIMPWRAKGVWASSALPKIKVLGIPVMSVIAGAYSVFLIFVLALWLKDAVYGSNNSKSLIYMGILYLVAALIWVAAAITRRSQGMPLEAVAREVPVE